MRRKSAHPKGKSKESHVEEVACDEGLETWNCDRQWEGRPRVRKSH